MWSKWLIVSNKGMYLLCYMWHIRPLTLTCWHVTTIVPCKVERQYLLTLQVLPSGFARQSCGAINTLWRRQLPYKGKMQYLLTCKVSGYCLLPLQRQPLVTVCDMSVKERLRAGPLRPVTRLINAVRKVAKNNASSNTHLWRKLCLILTRGWQWNHSSSHASCNPELLRIKPTLLSYWQCWITTSCLLQIMIIFIDIS